METLSRACIKESISLSTALPSSRSPKSEKLQAFYSRKTADQQLTLMSNRVNQLQKIKKKTEKEVELLRIQILKEEQSIRERDSENQKKRRFSQDNFEFLQKKAEQNRARRLGTRQTIRDFKAELLKQRQTLVKEKQENSLKWQEELSDFKAKDLETKAKNYKKIKKGYVRSMRDRIQAQHQHKSEIRSRYEESIETERRVQNEAISKVAQLESAETNLIEDLSKTLEVQQTLQATLRRLRTLSL